MSMTRATNVIIGALLAIVPCIVLVLLLIMIGYSAATKDECLKYGYPQAKLTLFFTRYCVKREGNSDVVKTLEELRK